MKTVERFLLRFLRLLGIAILVLFITSLLMMSFSHWRNVILTFNPSKKVRYEHESLERVRRYKIDDPYLFARWWYQKSPGKPWRIVVALFNGSTWDRRIVACEVSVFNVRRGLTYVSSVVSPIDTVQFTVIKPFDIGLFYFDAMSNKQIGIFKNSARNYNLLRYFTIPGKAALESILPFQHLQSMEVKDTISMCIDEFSKTGIFTMLTKSFILESNEETEVTYYFSIPDRPKDFIANYFDCLDPNVPFSKRFLEIGIKYPFHSQYYFPPERPEDKCIRVGWFAQHFLDQVFMFPHIDPHPPVVPLLPPFDLPFREVISKGKIKILDWGGAVRSDSVSNGVIKASWFDYESMGNGKLDSFKLRLRAPEFVPGGSIWEPWTYIESVVQLYSHIPSRFFFIRAKEPYKKRFSEAIYSSTLERLTNHSFIIILDSLLLLAIGLSIWRFRRRRRKLRAKSSNEVEKSEVYET